MKSTLNTSQKPDAGQNSAKHTPGPWRAVYNRVRTNNFVQTVVCQCGPDIDVIERIDSIELDAVASQHEANARLIASAPDLLAERDWLQKSNDELRCDLAGMESERDALKARAASQEAFADKYLAQRNALKAQNAKLREALRLLLALNQPDYESGIARAALEGGVK